jgi:hypothetical protein
LAWISRAIAEQKFFVPEISPLVMEKKNCPKRRRDVLHSWAMVNATVDLPDPAISRSQKIGLSAQSPRSSAQSRIVCRIATLVPSRHV